MTLLANLDYLWTYYSPNCFSLKHEAQFLPYVSHVRLCSYTAYSWATNRLWNPFILYQKKAVWGRKHEIITMIMYSIVIRVIQQHKYSNIHLFVMYATCFGRYFQPSSGGRGFSFTVLFKSEIIIIIPRNNEILKLRSLSIGKLCI